MKRKSYRIKHFSHRITSKNSQFDYFGGNASCTYCCFESCLYLLLNPKAFDNLEFRKKFIVNDIDEITATGVYFDEDIGFTSGDEVIKMNSRYSDNLSLGGVINGRVQDKDCWYNLLKEIESRKENVCCVLTKPAETVLIYYYYNRSLKKYQFVIYDSHPRAFGMKREVCVAGFYFFANLVDCEKHLNEIFPILLKREKSYDKLKELSMNYNLFEGTLVFLKDKKKKRDPEEITFLKRDSVYSIESFKKKKKKKKKTIVKKQGRRGVSTSGTSRRNMYRRNRLFYGSRIF